MFAKFCELYINSTLKAPEPELTGDLQNMRINNDDLTLTVGWAVGSLSEHVCSAELCHVCSAELCHVCSAELCHGLLTVQRSTRCF